MWSIRKSFDILTEKHGVTFIFIYQLNSGHASTGVQRAESTPSKIPRGHARDRTKSIAEEETYFCGQVYVGYEVFGMFTISETLNAGELQRYRPDACGFS